LHSDSFWLYLNILLFKILIIMTTLTINDKEVESIIDMYGRDTIINYIKTFKPTPKSRPKQKDDLDSRIRALKPVNLRWAERLKKAFEDLNEEFVNLGSTDYKQARDEYLTNKYSLWV